MQLPRPHSSLAPPLIAVLVVVTSLTVALGAARAATPGERVGVPTFGSAGTTRTTADIMRDVAGRIAEPEDEDFERNEHQWIKPLGLPKQPGDRVASVPALPPDQLVFRSTRPPGQTQSPQTVGLNFTGPTLATTGAFPPDDDGAVGPTQYVVAVNGRIISYNKTTGAADGVLNTTTNTFFNSVRNGSGTSDPQVRYDRLTARWFVTIINVSTPNRWLLAVSDAASNGIITAGTVWTYYFIVPATQTPAISNGSSILSDYPTLAVDANALYVGVDEFVSSSGAFQQVDVFVVRKSSVLSGGPIVVTVFRGLMTAAGGFVGPYAPRGVDNNDPSSNEGYFIGPDGASWGGMWLNRIANPGGTPTISSNIAITIPAEDGPRPVIHPGNTGGYWGYLDALDDRFFQATIRNQQLWTVHNIGVDNTGVSQGTYTADARVGARWFQINVPVTSGTPTVIQSGTVFTASANNDSLQKNFFMPSLTISGQGHVAMGFSTAGSADFVNAGTVGRLANDPAGTMQTPVQITTNTSNTYNPASDPGGISAGRPRRWGDYTQTTLDPLDDMTMWSVQQFVDANNSYACRVVQLKAPPPAAPASMPDVGDGQAAVSVTLTGTSSSGSGFYDPGSNLPSPARPFNHLTATVTNGGATGTPPTVVSATYVDPTHVNVVLNTSSATPNIGAEKYTITITNPDGQTAAAAVVRVIQSNFTITASAGSGGSISPSGAVSVPPGNNQSFTITADACHTIADVLVDGSSVGAVASYTFTNVQANHTIAASFNAIPYTIAASAGSNGSISPSGNVVVNCGTNQTFTITPAACYHIDDVVVDGSSVGAVASYTFTNVTANHTISASFAAGVPAPPAVTGLSASQLKSGNDTSGRTKVTLTFAAPGGGTTVEVWRHGYGGYPQYSGAAPASPGSYPPSGWTLTGVTASGQTDQPASRDYWYYVAYAKDGCGNASTVSNMSGGTLDYHLGDTSDGVTPGQGDNVVNTADASLLGANYGATGGSLVGVEYLDVGPTTTGTTDGRPTPDGIVEFEDLVMMAVNYIPHVSIVAKGPASTNAAAQAVDVLSVAAPASVTAGQELDVPVRLSAAADLLALSVTLGWNPAVVHPTSISTGELIGSQGGVVFSPGPGRADASLLGAESVMTGEGDVAVVHFQAIADGSPDVTVAHVIGRDGNNQNVSIAVQSPLAVNATPSRTQLFPALPNPTARGSRVAYSLAVRGHVDLAIYSIDGRRVKTVVRGEQAAGPYQISWDGTDDRGVLMTPGVYLIRLDAPGVRQSRRLSVIR